MTDKLQEKLASTGHASHRTKPCPCPQCGKKLDAAAPSDKSGRDAPRPGDVTICGYCASILIFDADMLLQLPDPKVLLELMTDISIVSAREVVMNLRAEMAMKRAFDELKNVRKN